MYKCGRYAVYCYVFAAVEMYLNWMFVAHTSTSETVTRKVLKYEEVRNIILII